MECSNFISEIAELFFMEKSRMHIDGSSPKTVDVVLGEIKLIIMSFIAF